MNESMNDSLGYIIVRYDREERDETTTDYLCVKLYFSPSFTIVVYVLLVSEIFISSIKSS